MKLLDLRAERVKVKTELYQANYQVNCNEQRGRINETAEDAKRGYENDLLLLKRLDAIENALFEAEATTYLNVEGNHLSLSTAKRYLEEINNSDNYTFNYNSDIEHWGTEDMVNQYLEGFQPFVSSKNMRVHIISRCCINRVDRLLQPLNINKDPLNLGERRKEFEEMMMNWILGLKKAIFMAEATTEVQFND